jgi:hypothetical protein
MKNKQQILKEKKEQRQYIIKKCIAMNTIFKEKNNENKLNDIFTIRLNSYMEKNPSLIREDNYDFDKIKYEIINTMCNDHEVLNIINTDYINIINNNIKDRFGFYIKHRNIIETSLLIGGVFLFISAYVGILTLLCKFWYWIIF